MDTQDSCVHNLNWEQWLPAVMASDPTSDFGITTVTINGTSVQLVKMTSAIISDLPPAQAVQKIYDYAGTNNLVYEGWALSDQTTSAAAWAIKKYIYVGGIQSAQGWASGNTNMDKVWDNRASYSYL